MNIKNIILIALVFVVLLVSISVVNAGLFDWFGGDGIKLTKETTSGFNDNLGDGNEYTSYCVEGVFQNLPDDSESYTIRTAIYDKWGKLIGEEEDYDSMEYISKSSETSTPDLLGIVTIEGYETVSFIELTLINTDGEIVFSKKIDFDMSKVEFYYDYDSYDDYDDYSDSLSSSHTSSISSGASASSKSSSDSSSSSIKSSNSHSSGKSSSNSFHMDDGNPTWEELNRIFP